MFLIVNFTTCLKSTAYKKLPNYCYIYLLTSTIEPIAPRVTTSYNWIELS
jgi:hypothetical protein